MGDCASRKWTAGDGFVYAAGEYGLFGVLSQQKMAQGAPVPEYSLFDICDYRSTPDIPDERITHLANKTNCIRAITLPPPNAIFPILQEKAPIGIVSCYSDPRTRLPRVGWQPRESWPSQSDPEDREPPAQTLGMGRVARIVVFLAEGS